MFAKSNIHLEKLEWISSLSFVNGLFIAVISLKSSLDKNFIYEFENAH